MKKKKEVNLSVPRWRNILLNDENIEDYTGFVYIIRNKKDGRYYIGKKNYWFKTTKPPLKGRVNKRRGKKESDWKSYWSSSDKLKEEIQKKGTKDWERQILKHCKTPFDLSYTELEWQMKMNVLFDEKSLNGIINVRLSRQKGKTIKEEVEDI